MTRWLTGPTVVVGLPSAGREPARSGRPVPDVTFSDGTTGEIEAGSKIVQSGVLTSCSYYSDDYRDYLGYYEDNTFASTDADEVRAFCLDHFADRDVS